MTELGFWKIAEAYPDRVAVVDRAGTETTYGELAAAQNRLADGLRAEGVARGDCVAALVWNQPQFLELALACAQSGYYFLPVNWHLTGSEVGYILDDSRARVLMASERSAEAASKAAGLAGLGSERCFAVGTIDGFHGVEHLTTGRSSEPPVDRTAGETMLYTSGTTGRPKGIRRPMTGASPETAVGPLTQFGSLIFNLEPGTQVQLVTGPLYHATPGTLAMIGLHLGHTLVLMDRWEPERTLELIERHQVSYLHLVPTMFQRLLSLPDDVRARFDLSSLRNAIHGAAPCPVDVKHRMIDWWGPVITEYYGSSEGGGTFVHSKDWLQRPGTVGTPWPGSVIKILDEEGRELPPMAAGSVYMKMPGFNFEYHNAPEKTRDSSRDGFFTVGDIGYIDPDGFLFLSGRTAELIISGGVNIYPAEIEGCLISHPAVADVAVIGVPNSEWGEEVKAIVQVEKGFEAGTAGLAEELVAHCRANLAGYKVPRSVEFRAELPRTEAGKLYKRLLHD